MKRKRWYGLIGLLSLLGFVGCSPRSGISWASLPSPWTFSTFSSGRTRLQEGQILRSAALGFFSGMGVTALAVLAALGPGLGGGRRPSIWGPAWAGGVSVAVYAVSSFWASLREWRHAGP